MAAARSWSCASAERAIACILSMGYRLLRPHPLAENSPAEVQTFPPLPAFPAAQGVRSEEFGESRGLMRDQAAVFQKRLRDTQGEVAMHYTNSQFQRG